MMLDRTDRFRLPLLHAGQAQKELTHNEALAMVDLLAAPAVEAVGEVTPPADPVPGMCWALGALPEGAWAGQALALAGWTDSGWRFVAPREGMSVWVIGVGEARFLGGVWRVAAAVADPAGGDVRDEQVRAALTALLAVLRGQGLISEA